MDTRQIEYILTIAEERSLSRAAEKLFLSQSALSQQLAKLKAEGLPPLFYRHKGEMLLTDAGKIYINGARTILKIYEDTSRLLHDRQDARLKHLRIAVSSRLQPLIYTRLLPWLKHSYPLTHVHISTSKGYQMRRAMEEGEVDIAIYEATRPQNNVLDYTVLCEEEFVLISPAGTEPDDLPVIIPLQGSHLRLAFDPIAAPLVRYDRIYTELNDTATILEMVRLGECAAFIPDSGSLDAHFSVRRFTPLLRFHTVAATRRGQNIPAFAEISKKLRELLAQPPAEP